MTEPLGPNAKATAVWRPGDDPGEPLRWLAALLRDQVHRWRFGHRRPVEAYFVAYPQLARFPNIGLTLAANEFLIRAARGETPKIDEYHRRFPQWIGRLADELAFLQEQQTDAPRLVEPGQTIRSEREDLIARSSWPRLPDYELLAELGRGGMAVVYRARQLGLNRPVALKVIASGALAGAAERQRMRREAEIVAQLRHPNAVQIYGIGEHDGCLFLSLEYVAGGSLDRRLNGHPLPPDEAAWLVEQLAGAVQAAHDAGIVHRDLKPANVLLDIDGTPKVTDFGLAKQRDDTLRITAAGAIAGTPSYMAPEQVAADAAKIGPATDVYGLGGILYECLTGRPPFDAPTALETLQQVAHDKLVSVCRIQAGVPRNLETICSKCLEKDPSKRYATARDLAADLARFRAGEPILARPATALERAWRWARRNPVVPLLAVTLGVMTLSVAGLMAWSTYHAYRVVGVLRERELHLHGLRGTLLQLDEAQARYADLAAATGDAAWAERHQSAASEADRLRAEAVLRAANGAVASDLISAAANLLRLDREMLELVQAGQRAAAWQRLQGDEYRRAREDYSAAVRRFGDNIDESADAELRQVQNEAFWSLALSTAVAGLLGITAMIFWLIYHRPRSAAAPRPPTQSEPQTQRPGDSSQLTVTE
jgi:tRNA A-37 threonylcarbamoyl transferase component Bud32